jgi:hypothetical protein
MMVKDPYSPLHQLGQEDLNDKVAYVCLWIVKIFSSECCRDPLERWSWPSDIKFCSSAYLSRHMYMYGTGIVPTVYGLSVTEVAASCIQERNESFGNN